MRQEWTDSRYASLKAFCDTMFPSLAVERDPHGFWARKASDFGVDSAAANLLRTTVPEDVEGALLGLLDALAAEGFLAGTQESREQILRRLVASSPVAALIECAHQGLGISAASIPWRSGREHKEILSNVARFATFIAIVRDRGHGRITVDDSGASVPAYPLDDALDVAHLRLAARELARLHRAAGAERIFSITGGELQWWRKGEDFDAFTGRLESAPVGVGGHTAFSAHQMGSARMGTDARTSVADPSGELHDVRGVWIGDTSAFPTALGVNPMITCMALASRTAERIAERAARRA